MSLPPLPLSVSLPAPPQRTLALPSPVSRSAPEPPMRFSTPEYTSPAASPELPVDPLIGEDSGRRLSGQQVVGGRIVRAVTVAAVACERQRAVDAGKLGAVAARDRLRRTVIDIEDGDTKRGTDILIRVVGEHV